MTTKKQINSLTRTHRSGFNNYSFKTTVGCYSFETYNGHTVLVTDTKTGMTNDIGRAACKAEYIAKVQDYLQDAESQVKENAYIMRIMNDHSYDTMEEKFYGPTWEPRLDNVQYLESLMEMHPEKFIGCKIVIK